MKLNRYLFVKITCLFTILLNVFSLLLIQILFINSFNQNKTVAFQTFANIYAYVNDENKQSSYMTAEEIIRERAYSYLNLTTNGYQQELEFLNQKGKSIYQSNDNYKVPKDLLKTKGNDISYLLTKEEGNHFLILSRKLELKNQTYHLVYYLNVESSYQQRYLFFFYLLIFNIFSLLVAGFIIGKLSVQISRPLSDLLKKIQNLAKQDYTGEIETISEIEEIQTLSDQVNDMSHKINYHVNALELKNQQQERFISALTHEIRTPLTAIIGYSSLYKGQEKVKGVDKLPYVFTQIYQNGKRIEQLSENLFRLISLDKSEVKLEIVELLSFMEDIQASLKQVIERENIQFTIEGEKCYLETDIFLLRTLLVNIIDNGIKASREKQERLLNVKISSNEIIISDNGSGISEEDLEKIFEPFYTVDKSRSTLKNGFGLGMSLVHDIAELLEFDITINSELNKGTTVIIHQKEFEHA